MAIEDLFDSLDNNNIYPYMYLDWSSSECLYKNRFIFGPEQRHFLEVLFRKEQYNKDKGIYGSYFQNAFALLAAEYRHSVRIACCGRQGKFGNGSCQKWRLCNCCAEKRKFKMLRAFLPAFHGKKFLFFTISSAGCLEFEHADHWKQAVIYWEAAIRAINYLQDMGLISGSLFVEEIAIRSIQPVTILPHVHGIFHIDNFGGYTADVISRGLHESILAQLPGSAVEPSIKVQSVNSDVDFLNCVKYLTKPISLMKRYYPDFEDVYEYVQDSTVVYAYLNKGICRFLEGFESVTASRQSIRRSGTMHHASRQYIGTLAKDKWTVDFVKKFFEDMRKSGVAGAKSVEI